MDFKSRLETYAGTTLTTSHLVFAGVAIYLLAFGPRVSRVLGFAQTTYFHARRPLSIPLKDGSVVPLDQFCKSVIPPCRLNPFLFNGHLQTIWTAVANTSRDVYYKRWIFEQEDPVFAGSFAVDFVVRPYQQPPAPLKNGKKLPPRTTDYTQQEFDAIGSDDKRPMLVALHGLSGGSHELYLREMLAKLTADADADGWEACVVNSRGCAESELTSPVLYNARATWDVRQFVKWLRRRYPNRPLFGCGFSLGANIISNYIGEEGERCEFKAAVVLSNPWNLEIGHKALHSTWMGLNVYATSMGQSLKALFIRHEAMLSQNPDFDVPAIKKLKYLYDFDTLVQTKSWGYPTATAYYRDASSVETLLNVRIPILAINALDDPITSAEGLPLDEIQQTPYGVMCATELGGHLSWFELGGTRWYVRAGAEVLKKFAHDVDLDSLPRPGDSMTNGHVNSAPDGKDFVVKPGLKGHNMLFTPLRRRWHIDTTSTS